MIGSLDRRRKVDREDFPIVGVWEISWVSKRQSSDFLCAFVYRFPCECLAFFFGREPLMVSKSVEEKDHLLVMQTINGNCALNQKQNIFQMPCRLLNGKSLGGTALKIPEFQRQCGEFFDARATVTLSETIQVQLTLDPDLNLFYGAGVVTYRIPTSKHNDLES
ncbi:hypothetical protein SISNIDRAFT_290902 [Sistotremastrum niveocremeum HHB9708]|uniref:Uncharacterized protein n=1 Tax=Sistotremastrum niveocremeum HHB9708 TaxID=1314777 RepID=A0A164YIW3_9AGAM|nr:hypothetical protein SISNIDRAFT_290902 [Sistotremastrum niveocremeum HHB9708]